MNKFIITLDEIRMQREDATDALVEREMKDPEMVERNITPLHLAAMYNSINKATKFVNNGMNVNAQDNYGKTPLHYSVVLSNDTDISELLLKNNAKINIQDIYHKTPLQYACEYRYKHSEELLQQYQLLHAIKKENTQQIQEWLDKTFSAKLNTTKFCVELWETAFRTRNENLIILLLTKPFELNVTSMHGQECMGPPLWTAVLCKMDNVAVAFINNGAFININKYGKTLLYQAITHHTLKTAKLLIEKNVIMNTHDENRNNELHAAIMYMPKVAKLIIAKNMFINTQNVNGDTPLHLAIAAHDMIQIVKLLIQHGASACINNGVHDSAFLLIFHFYSTEPKIVYDIVNTILTHGACKLCGERNCINTPLDLVKETALHLAIRYHMPNVANLLLEHDASLTIKNIHGETALDTAKKFKDEEIVDMILKH